MVVELPGLVESSNNVATVKTETLGDRIAVTVGCMARSSSMPELHLVAEQITSVGRLGAAQVEVGNAYPGWKPSLDSPVLKTCQAIYRKVFGREPLVTAIHAGDDDQESFCLGVTLFVRLGRQGRSPFDTSLPATAGKEGRTP